ncbi:lipoprotein [Alphaproteobacteria bacterium]|nr:lipoprotein [Alphaproteobacteria bacterium]
MNAIARLCLGVMLLASGCVSISGEAEPPRAWLTPEIQIELPPPGIAPSVKERQVLTGFFAGKQHSLLVLLDADDRRLSLAGLSPLGIRLFQLSYDSSGIHTEQFVALPEMPPASQVLMDVMLSYWPQESWASRLPEGWSLTDGKNRRELRDFEGRLVATVEFRTEGGKRAPVGVTQHRFDYRIAIERLED